MYKLFRKISAGIIPLLTAALLFTGCYELYESYEINDPVTVTYEGIEENTEFSIPDDLSASDFTEHDQSTAADTMSEAPPQNDYPEDTAEDAPSVEKDGSYTTPEDVAEYIHTFGTLPKNFITKNEAKKLGWVSSEGNLWEVAEGMSIGGDRFGNYEGILPEGDYTECDVNYSGGFRGSERLVFSDEGIYYTNDHYASFTQLY